MDLPRVTQAVVAKKGHSVCVTQVLSQSIAPLSLFYTAHPLCAFLTSSLLLGKASGSNGEPRGQRVARGTGDKRSGHSCLQLDVTHGFS